ncbi:hypothetical protein [uncultured Campylobacter sp.]|uniref:hypothetical protein n=1 Tax=uncultured Campylobacter sp. TaxID=218934 RepID=UPI0015ABF342|nr:hypothetical protein [uncultured Campylobacter sp.]
MQTEPAPRILKFYAARIDTILCMPSAKCSTEINFIHSSGAICFGRPIRRNE